MSTSLLNLITFPTVVGTNGSLTPIQSGRKDSELPFIVKRTLVIRGMKAGDERGGHTHHKTRQVLIALSGGCTVELDNGKEKTSVALSRPDQGLVLEPYVWHAMKDFKPSTILLLLADTEYDEKDYIRDYAEFKKFVK